MRTAAGDLAVIYFPAGGSAAVKSGLLSRDLQPRWYNPRTGQWLGAATTAGNAFTAPDREDWALLFEGNP